MVKKKDIWHQLEAKTNKQITLWILTISTAILLGNNILSFISNMLNNSPLSPFVYLISLFLIRIILGKLFD